MRFLVFCAVSRRLVQWMLVVFVRARGRNRVTVKAKSYRNAWNPCTRPEIGLSALGFLEIGGLDGKYEVVSRAHRREARQ